MAFFMFDSFLWAQGHLQSGLKAIALKDVFIVAYAHLPDQACMRSSLWMLAVHSLVVRPAGMTSVAPCRQQV